MNLAYTLIPSITAVVGAIGATVNAVQSLRPLRPRKITYRVHLDEPAQVDQPAQVDEPARADLPARADDPTPEDEPARTNDTGTLVVERRGKVVADGSIVLVRIRNERNPVNVQHYDAPITFTFPGRTIIGVHISEASDDALADNLGRRFFDGDKLTLPPILLNRGDRFKLRILLSGKGHGVVAHARIENGTLRPDLGLPWPGRTTMRSMLWGLLLTASLVAVIASLALSPRSAHIPPPAICKAGNIIMAGSTAFAPAASDVASNFHDTCPSSDIQVNPSGFPGGSYNEVNDLNRDVKDKPALRDERVAMSDGIPDARYPDLEKRPAAIVIFSVVVNKDTGVNSLTTRQLRSIYGGAITNWKDVGGHDEPIAIISRESTSGTRNTFDQKVLEAEESASTADRCGQPKAPSAPVVQCEAQSTEDLLKDVNATPGAIGYADLTTTSSLQSTYNNIVQIQLNDRDATIDEVRNNQYPFWAVEYMYTYGSPREDTLLSNFLTYLTTSDTAKKILLSHGHFPCLDDRQNLIDKCKE